MKKLIQWVICVCVVLVSNVQAQSSAFPAECYRRCTTLLFEEPEQANEKFVEKLRSIQARRKAETDPVKAKALAQEEAAETERLEASLAKSCRKMCRYEE